MKLGSTLGGPQEGLADRAQALEDAGVDVLFAGEAYGSDAVSTLGFLAAVTSRVRLASSILPIYSRTPSLLAMTAIGLDRLSAGRFILGLGTSGPQVIEGFHGVAYDGPLGRTREVIEICRALWRRERLEHHGHYYEIPLPAERGTGLGKPLKFIDHPVRDRIPIFVASLGPKNVEMTAELAEGWLPLYFWPEGAEAVWGEPLAAGRAKREAGLPPLEIVAGGPLAIGSGLDDLRDASRPTLALYFGGMGARGANFYNDLLRRYGFEREAAAIQDAYLSGDRAGAAALVPAELVEGLSLVGDAGFVRDRVEAFRAAGVSVLDVRPVGRDPRRDIETVAGWLA